MPVAINTGNVTTVQANGLTTLTSNTTCSAAVKGLLVLAGYSNGTAAAAPTGVTYNSVAMTLLSHQELTFNYRGSVSAWWLANPTTGSSLACTATLPTAISEMWMTAIPLIGVDTTRTPSAGTPATGTATNTPACSTPAAAAADLQFASMFTTATAITDGGGAQTIVPSTGLTLPSGPTGTLMWTADSIPGPTAGNFSWTIPLANNWIALGVTVFGVAASGPSGVWGGSEGLIGAGASQGLVGGASAQGLWDGVEGLR